jgi:hypothetical protein
MDSRFPQTSRNMHAPAACALHRSFILRARHDNLMSVLLLHVISAGFILDMHGISWRCQSEVAHYSGWNTSNKSSSNSSWWKDLVLARFSRKHMLTLKTKLLLWEISNPGYMECSERLKTFVINSAPEDQRWMTLRHRFWLMLPNWGANIFQRRCSVLLTTNYPSEAGHGILNHWLWSEQCQTQFRADHQM